VHLGWRAGLAWAALALGAAVAWRLPTGGAQAAPWDALAQVAASAPGHLRLTQGEVTVWTQRPGVFTSRSLRQELLAAVHRLGVGNVACIPTSPTLPAWEVHGAQGSLTGQAFAVPLGRPAAVWSLTVWAPPDQLQAWARRLSQALAPLGGPVVTAAEAGNLVPPRGMGALDVAQRLVRAAGAKVVEAAGSRREAVAFGFGYHDPVVVGVAGRWVSLQVWVAAQGHGYAVAVAVPMLPPGWPPSSPRGLPGPVLPASLSSA
jgi:hypothetical protein